MTWRIDNIQFLATSAHRVGVLKALRDGPTDRRSLCEATDASSPTVGRVLGDFEERRWLVRDGPTYELTPLGEYVADRFLAFRDAMEIEEKLRDVCRWLPREMPGFSVDLFADAVVSYPGPGSPYEPVERLGQFSRRPRRCAGSTPSSTSRATSRRRAALSSRERRSSRIHALALEGMFAWNPDRINEVAACENAPVLVHNGDRCGLGIVDDRVGICCHDAEARALVAVIDTDAPKAREWAISVFEQVRAEATPVHPAAFESHSPS